MPTGYTSFLEEGATFEEFVWRCARAFGAYVTMREESLDAPMPMEIKPSTYHKKELEKAEANLAKVREMTLKEAERLAAREYKQNAEHNKSTREEYNKKHAIYSGALEKATAWKAPKALLELKTFMIDQLNLSKPYPPDCFLRDMKKPMSPEEYKAHAIEDAQRDVDYHTRNWQEEQDRAAERTKWIQTLAKSIPPPASITKKK